ncbi:tubulin PhuZ [Pseudomonas phage Noxifer]|uniref:PhuZ n=1 Tax=Pseudomonas phage Noxifer TaxID=2006684 RepID=A0A1Y0SUL6_9CAUD|nr:tubulin PhuZ [Pseudomonas phage Noxifer]ARV77202.1 PhuZ [Pseudomonas phage Noxifer]
MNDLVHPAKLHAPVQTQKTGVPKLAIYCAGAFGIKTGTRTPNDNADTRISYIDTSEANLTTSIDEKKVYRIPMPAEEGQSQRGGAGQDRRRATKAALPHIKPILDTFVPGEFNILVASSSGASGSSVMALLAREMIRRDQSFMIITVGELSTPKYLVNTKDSWASLENISLSLKRPIVMAYFENGPGILPSAVDQDVQFVIEAVQALTTQFNEDLDESDIYNWLNYNNVTSVGPQLSTVTITDNAKAAGAVLEPIATLSLFSDRDAYRVVGTPHYIKAGYPREPLICAHDELHFVINSISVDEISKRLKETETTQRQTHGNYRQRAALVNTRDDDTIDDCIVVS